MGVQTSIAGGGFLETPLHSPETSVTAASSCLMIDQVPPVLVIFSIIYCAVHRCSHWKISKILTIKDMLYPLRSVKNKAQPPIQILWSKFNVFKNNVTYFCTIKIVELMSSLKYGFWRLAFVWRIIRLSLNGEVRSH